MRSIQNYLKSSAHPIIFNIYCVVAAFTTYFCMYAYRKPFAAGRFEGSLEVFFLPTMDYKIFLIIAQIFGYALSKFIGIKVVSELSRERRALAIFLIISAAELALLGFALTPRPVNAIFLFINGLALGMVWGLVFGFLEGRKSSEFLGAGLCVSFIVSSGMVKSVGSWIMGLGVSEVWMPFLTGALFFPVLLVGVYLLNLIPPPDAEDEKLRVRREPMMANDRKRFFMSLAPGLVSLTLIYVLLTVLREFRDSFARELWDALGYRDLPAIFTATEIPIAIIVLVAISLFMKITDNRRALVIAHLMMIGCTLMVGLSTLAYQFHILSPVLWMILVGLGLYGAYVPFNCMLFDRLIASVGFVGTAGFMIYVTDAFGYLGSVGMLLYKNFGFAQMSWLNFFIDFSYILSIVCSCLFVYSLLYFKRCHA